MFRQSIAHALSYPLFQARLTKSLMQAITSLPKSEISSIIVDSFRINYDKACGRTINSSL